MPLPADYYASMEERYIQRRDSEAQSDTKEVKDVDQEDDFPF